MPGVAEDDAVAVGFRCHSGWAMAVVVTGSAAAPAVLERSRVELVDGALPRQPYHAVAEEGRSRTVIAEVERAATAAISGWLRSVPRVDVVGLIAADRRIPENLDQILASHMLLHAAEGQLYERAVIDAAGDAGLDVHVVDPHSVAVPPAVESLGRSIGPPWRQDHKWAAAAALAALAGR